MAKIVICGYMVRHPVAGNLLAYFHYLLGFSRLGHRVVYLEESGWPDSCFDPGSGLYGNDPAAGLMAAAALSARYGLALDVGYFDRETRATFGMSWAEMRHHLQDADLLLNIGGVCWLPEFVDCRRRALIDLDPLFTQLGRFAPEGLGAYHVLFSYGLNIGRHDCPIPTCGRRWHPALPPVAPEIWQRDMAALRDDAAFTTVANWNAYGGITYEGRHYGQKREAFLGLGNLPARSSAPLELALTGIDDGEVAALKRAGWRVRDSAFSADYDAYRDYIARSRGEFSVAKDAYVAMRSGWFSDRSVCYLAAARPAVLQDTGFSRHLETGQGLLCFTTGDEALAALAAVTADYACHCKAARDLAEDVFSYRKVLPGLLQQALSQQV